jgi:protein-tyrosine phosphatase
VNQLAARTLHPVRRRSARRSLRAAGSRHILVLCTGNVCRSPYAEARLRSEFRRRGWQAEVVSAGFIGPGRPTPELAQEAARGRGLDTSGHRSQLVTPALLARSGLVVVMDAEHARRLAHELGAAPCPVLVLGDLDPVSPASRAIPDPWGHPLDVFHSSFARIDRCLEVLLEQLAEDRPRPRPSAAPAALAREEGGR